VVRPALRLAAMVAAADRRLVDGAVESTGPGAQRLGRILARTAAGNVQLYLTGMVAGAVVIGALLAVFR
jgi:NADH-quinone oxidoreductase subunit L